MLQLQRNVPKPGAQPVRDGRRKYPFDSMQVGDFVFVPNKSRNSIRTYFITAGKQHGIKLSSELIYARQDEETGTWKPCEADTPGAVQGVGVWRDE